MEVGWRSLANTLIRAAASIGTVLFLLGAAPVEPKRMQGAGAGAAEGSGEPSSPGGAPTFRLINKQQYANAIADVFGSDVRIQTGFAPVRRTEGLLALGAGAAAVTPGALDIFDAAARSVAAQVTDPAHRQVLIPCVPRDFTQADDTCARMFLSKTGRLLFRRTLSEQELSAKVQVAHVSAENLKSFYAGLGSALTSLLIAPDFLFFAERTEVDPRGGMRLDAGSKALRLSLLLWDAPPDELLLQAAEKAELHTDAGLRAQIQRMLRSPRIESGVRAFFDDFLVLEDFDQLAKDPVIYPAFSLKVAADAKEQTLRTIIDHLLSADGDYRDLFTSRRTFLTQSLGVIYRVPVSAAGSLDWVPYDIPENDPRAGILTQVGFLAIYAHSGRTSPTRRGRGLREVFLCQKVPDPPPNVDFSIVEDPNARFATARERLQAHNTDKTCSGCHKITDPIGLALEKFDGAAQYRDNEHGAVIDTSGELDGRPYNDAKGLGEATRAHPALTSCLVKRVYQYGVGRQATRDEKPVLTYLEKEFADRGYTFKGLLESIVNSRAFYRVTDEREVSASTASTQ